MGGAFDPIHYGHLVTAEEARVQFELERVIFMPTGSPPHKTLDPGSTSVDRSRMVELAIAGNSSFELSTLEIDKDEIAYTVDTLRELRSQLGPEAGLFFITGADAILEIMTWKDPLALCGLCEFIAATRPGYDFDDFKVEIGAVTDGLRGRGEEMVMPIHRMEIPALSISSTDIRSRVRSGRPIRYLVPEQVSSYILDNRLYLGPNGSVVE